MEDGQVLQRSFDLYISGREGDTSMGEFIQFDENKEWCSPPTGARFGLAYQSRSERLRLIEKEAYERWRQTHPDE